MGVYTLARGSCEVPPLPAQSYFLTDIDLICAVQIFYCLNLALSCNQDTGMNAHYFTMMAAYNKWANAALYDAAATLDGHDFNRDVSAFFKSMQGTLNHLLAADQIWMRRFTGEGNAPRQLDEILHRAFPALRIAREVEDRRIMDWIDELDDAAFHGRFTYMTMTNPRTVSQHLAPALVHFFNHQTHHRGQAHMILSVLGHHPPTLDLIYFHRTSDGSRFA